MRYLRLFLVVACLINGVFATGLAQASVLIAVSEGSPDYAETAEALRAQLQQVEQDKVEVTSKSWRDVVAGGATGIRVIVSVGSSAFSGIADAVAAGKLPKLSLVATLLPRSSFESIKKRTGVNATAVLLDQPLSRQMTLLRYAFPTMRKVGVLLGPDSKALAPALGRAAEDQGLQLVEYRVEGEEKLYSSLQGLLEESEALLAIPDPMVFNGTSIQNILLATYRQKIPMVGFSPGYIRAGAVLALYSTPAQIGTQTAKMTREVLSGSFPAPQSPHDFSVGVNLNVARSLGYRLNEDALKQQIRGKEGQQ